MARPLRSRFASGALEPGRTYHVANRGHNRAPIFHTDTDRFVFLAMLAEACVLYGAVCHVFCLMTNHFHLVLEDRRGTLSQLMHRVQFCYARYFNATRAGGREDAVFKSRFRAEMIDSRAYFDAACAYVLLNPVRTQTPMAESAEGYRWSSAALVCSDLTPAAWAEALLAPAGGVEGVLAAMRPTKFKTSRDLRRARMDAFASGAWVARERVLGERTPEQYRLRLAERAARTTCHGVAQEDDAFKALAALAADERAKVANGADAADLASTSTPSECCPLDDSSAPLPTVPSSIPLRSVVASPLASDPQTTNDSYAASGDDVPYGGVALDGEVAETIRAACERAVASGLVGACERLADVVTYTLHRFTSATHERVATAAGLAADAVESAIDRVRGVRRRETASDWSLWRLEWGLRWKLRAGPHRA